MLQLAMSSYTSGADVMEQYKKYYYNSIAT